ncbi:MAG: GNAT family N-acetyltransferase [Bacteroidales bacterium]|nr:GNAT family N-acetyltransferase [Bacteroidales bacterium]
MKITLRPVNEADFKIIEPLYVASFPAEERRDVKDLTERALDHSDPFFSLQVIEDDGVTAGFVTMWRLPFVDYIEHLAVEPAKRGNGIGAEALAIIKDKAKRPILLEVERPDLAPDKGLAERRIEFYKRLGFRVIDTVDYIQPPYAKNLPEVPMLLMSDQPIADIDTVVSHLKTIVYNQ